MYESMLNPSFAPSSQDPLHAAERGTTACGGLCLSPLEQLLRPVVRSLVQDGFFHLGCAGVPIGHQVDIAAPDGRRQPAQAPFLFVPAPGYLAEDPAVATV